MLTGCRFQYPYTKLFLAGRRAEQQFALYKWFMTNLDLLIVTNECVVLPRSRRLDMRLVQFPPIWALTNTETKWQIFALFADLIDWFCCNKFYFLSLFSLKSRSHNFMMHHFFITHYKLLAAFCSLGYYDFICMLTPYAVHSLLYYTSSFFFSDG